MYSPLDRRRPRRRRRLEADDRREQLIQAALQVAARGDARSVTLADLAGEAGVSVGLLYHYFDDKQALLSAALWRAADMLLADLEHRNETETFQRFLELLHRYLCHVESHREGWMALNRTDSDATERVHLATRSMLLGTLGIDEPGPGLDLAVAGWLSFQRGLCAAWADQPEVGRHCLSMILVDAFIVALKAASWYDETAGEALARLEVA